jgi:hypothetical protein
VTKVRFKLWRSASAAGVADFKCRTDVIGDGPGEQHGGQPAMTSSAVTACLLNRCRVSDVVAHLGLHRWEHPLGSGFVGSWCGQAWVVSRSLTETAPGPPLLADDLVELHGRCGRFLRSAGGGLAAATVIRPVRCRETGTAGSASGLGKRTGSNPGTAPQADSTTCVVDAGLMNWAMALAASSVTPHARRVDH